MSQPDMGPSFAPIVFPKRPTGEKTQAVWTYKQLENHVIAELAPWKQKVQSLRTQASYIGKKLVELEGTFEARAEAKYNKLFLRLLRARVEKDPKVRLEAFDRVSNELRKTLVEDKV